MALALLGALVTVAPAAEADTVYCIVGDMDCWMECKTRDVKHLVASDHCRFVPD